MEQSYALEYGLDRLQMHRDAIAPGDRVLIVDDVIATGGTALASAKLVEALGGKVIGYGFVVELTFLNGRETAGRLRRQVAGKVLKSSLRKARRVPAGLP